MALACTDWGKNSRKLWAEYVEVLTKTHGNRNNKSSLFMNELGAQTLRKRLPTKDLEEDTGQCTAGTKGNPEQQFYIFLCFQTPPWGEPSAFQTQHTQKTSL